MSDPEEDWFQASVYNVKKRKIRRACDRCRKGKTRCNGSEIGIQCANCVGLNVECTYLEPSLKRGPPKAYVESLESRIEKISKLLQRIHPTGEYATHINMSSNNDSTSEAMLEAFHQLTVDDPGLNNRFFGRSSVMAAIQAALKSKHGYQEETSSTSRSSSKSQVSDPPNSPREVVSYTFPEPDLLVSLIDLYFENMNIFLPLLHRPTFERSIAEGLHLVNAEFASTLLVVCSIASKFSNDRRVFLDGVESLHGCGWVWYSQVQGRIVIDALTTGTSTLHTLQFYALVAVFLYGSSAPQSSYIIVGIGVKLAQDVGAHRKKPHPSTMEDELRKRAFWVLITIDRIISAFLGRPCSNHEEDFDAELPVACDDADLEAFYDISNPNRPFETTTDPSAMSYFVCLIELHQILASSLRTVCCTNRPKMLLGFSEPKWEQFVVEKLDSALNSWLDSVPAHLRWDPSNENPIFFAQSVVLYTTYYQIQILIHRPFCHSSTSIPTIPFPSLAISTNAARCCSHIVDIHMCRSKTIIPLIMPATFASGLVLLVHIWGGKRTHTSTDPMQEMEDVRKCMRMLKVCEQRWLSAGRLWDILNELVWAADIPLPAWQSSRPSQKREREDSPDLGQPEPARRFIGVRRDTSPVSLPMSSAELGQLPLHGEHTFLRQHDSHLCQPNLDQTHHPDMDYFPDMDPLKGHTSALGSDSTRDGAFRFRRHPHASENIRQYRYTAEDEDARQYMHVIDNTIAGDTLMDDIMAI